jgi:hypothetical protein
VKAAAAFFGVGVARLLVAPLGALQDGADSLKVALAVSGIKRQRTVIKAAQYRAQISDFDKLNTAINVFYGKYNCLPGDCANATTFFGAASQPQQVTNGDGNGHISIMCSTGGIGWNGCTGMAGYSGNGDDPAAGNANVRWMGSRVNGPEWMSVYDHLAAASLVIFPQYDETISTPPVGTVCPLLRFSVAGGVSDLENNGTVTPCMSVAYIPGNGTSSSPGYVSTGHKIALGAAGNYTAGASAGVNGWDAYAIDSKIDDGLPYSGSATILPAGAPFNSWEACTISVSGVWVYRTENNPWLDGSSAVGHDWLPARSTSAPRGSELRHSPTP